MAVRLTGNFYTSAGVATCGAAVAIFPASTAATQSTSVCSATATTTTNSTGVWDELTLAANTYDVRITSGSSVRWRRYNEEVQHTTFQTGDDGNFYLGNGVDVGHRWSTGDASNHAYVIGIGDTSQQMHITDLGAIATDWARSAGTHPELAIHSNTTPITDYMAIGNHDGTTGNIDVVGGPTLALKIAGNTEASITAAGLVLPACSDLSFTGSTGTNDIVLTNGLADALSITDGSADVVVVDTSTAGNVITMTSAVTVSNGLTSTAAANTLGATSFNDADVTNVGDIALDSISADNNVINIAVTDNQATALTIKQGSDAYLIIDTANSSESVSIGTGINGTAITLGHSTSEVTVADNLTVTGDMTVNGTTTTVNSTTLTVDDPIITLGGDTAPGSDDNKDRGVEFRYHHGSCARVGFFGYDDSASVFTGLTAATNSSEVFSGTVMNAVFGTIGGTLTTASQTNITSLGTLGSIDINGGAVDGVTIGTNAAATELQVDYINANASTLTITDSSDTGDLASLAVTTHGATTLTTTDDDATAAHLTLDADGNITLDAATGIVTIEDAGTEILRLTESCSGDVTVKLVTNAKDLIFTDNGDAEGFRILDAAVGVKVAGTLDLGHATANTLSASSGVLSIEGNRVFHAGGTDIPVADGGTGASTFTANGILVGNGTSAIAVTATMATKGHLMIGDGSGVPSMLAVGCNNQLLTACSSEATGVKWAAAAAGVSLGLVIALS